MDNYVGIGFAAVAATYVNPALGIGIGVTALACKALYQRVTADPTASNVEKTKSADPEERLEALNALAQAYNEASTKISLNVLRAIFAMLNDDNANALEALKKIRDLINTDKLIEADKIGVAIKGFIITFKEIAKYNLDLKGGRIKVIRETISTLHEFLVKKKASVKIDKESIGLCKSLSASLSNLIVKEGDSFKSLIQEIRTAPPLSSDERMRLKLQELQSRCDDIRKAAIEELFQVKGSRNIALDQSMVTTLAKIGYSDEAPSVRNAAFKALAGAYDRVDSNNHVLIIKMIIKNIISDVHGTQALAEIQLLIRNDELNDTEKLQAAVDGFVDCINSRGTMEWGIFKSEQTRNLIGIIDVILVEFIDKYKADIDKERINITQLSNALQKILQDMPNEVYTKNLRSNMQEILKQMA